MTVAIIIGVIVVVVIHHRRLRPAAVILARRCRRHHPPPPPLKVQRRSRSVPEVSSVRLTRTTRPSPRGHHAASECFFAGCVWITTSR